jgi:hypothetical protein
LAVFAIAPGSVDVKKEPEASKKPETGAKFPHAGGKRTESPDNDSAFCDNLSVLSSCSASSLHTATPSNPAESPVTLTPEEQVLQFDKFPFRPIRFLTYFDTFYLFFLNLGHLVFQKIAVNFFTLEFYLKTKSHRNLYL